ncbi:MAG TPA: DUF1761 domain-containing protein [Saprospiraceae bacterium]|jgi:hypothetical protein|nr:DUF1761 domain-containing protein [Saprospiraceae bacterium]
MTINWLAILVSALVPMLLGFIWYHPKVMGKVWMDACGFKEEDMKSTSNMGLIFGISFLMSLLLAFAMNTISYHQTFVANSLMNQPGFGDPNSEVGKYLADYMAKYGTNFRTFSHGAAHGILIAGIMIVVPVLTTNALFEKKGFKYIAVNAGYWLITLGLMGGIVCAWI